MTTHAIDVTTPDDLEIRVTRVFDAPRSLIFECHTQPELVRRWLLGPPGWWMPVCEIDLRVSGQYRYVWRSDTDGGEFGFRGEYREIRAPERVVHTERIDGADANDAAALCTLELTEQGGRTILTQSMRFPTSALRDQALASGMSDGMASSYDRLEQVLDERPRA
jgi:uncharacterized protein YndB with AHSA1/START domain